MREYNICFSWTDKDGTLQEAGITGTGSNMGIALNRAFKILQREYGYTDKLEPMIYNLDITIERYQ